jgi:hypothetical protein
MYEILHIMLHKGILLTNFFISFFAIDNDFTFFIEYGARFRIFAASFINVPLASLDFPISIRFCVPADLVLIYVWMGGSKSNCSME